jgi:hypothetical protein
VRALHGEHGTLHDRTRRFADIAQRCDLWEKVLGVSTGTCMLVRADYRYIFFAVDTGIDARESGDDGTPDAAVPEGYVYVPRQRPQHSDVTWAMSSKRE